MAAALKFMDYDYKLVWGEGTHNARHGGNSFELAELSIRPTSPFAGECLKSVGQSFPSIAFVARL